MEELGLDPMSEVACLAYTDHLEDEAEREMAEEGAAIEAQYVADEVELDAMERAAFAPPKEAERILTEARRAAPSTCS
jgi:hypothetical protein